MLLCICVLAAGADLASAVSVVIVRASDAEPYVQADAALRQKLAEHRCAVRSSLAKEVAEKGIGPTFASVDAVVAVGTQCARWLHQQPLPANVKLIYCMVNNAGEAGLLQGRECWGVTTEVPLSEQVKLVAATLPRVRTMGMLYRSDAPEGREALASLRAAVPTGWRVEAVAVSEQPSLAAAIETLTQRNVDMIWTYADPRLYDTATVRALLLAGLRKKIPVWGFSTAFVRAGALVGVGVEPAAQGSQAADLTVKVVTEPGAIKPGVVPPREYQIAVNLIVAEQLSLEVPESVWRQAAYVYRSEK
jgi:ABC-type uncharacterized transport system substrate-binding protein